MFPAPLQRREGRRRALRQSRDIFQFFLSTYPLSRARRRGMVLLLQYIREVFAADNYLLHVKYLPEVRLFLFVESAENQAIAQVRHALSKSP